MANNVTDLGKVGITLKGEWSSATNYERLDAVTYEGSLYIAIKDNANVNPGANPTYWLLSAKHGEFTDEQLEDFKAEVVAESKEEMDDYTDDKKAELDTYEGTKETELNTYTGTKKTELDTYTGGLKDDFDDNASTKTTAFNDNATSKTTAFNTNATNKTTDFNDNATAKTTKFNTNASDKTDDFDDNAAAKTTAFDEHVEEKEEEFDENVESLQQEIDELAENMPWAETEQATEINITDAAKYSRNKLELFGNTEQASYTGKNLLPSDASTQTLNDVIITKNNDGSYTLNGTASALTSVKIGDIQIENGKTYTMSSGNSDDSSNSYRIDGRKTVGSIYNNWTTASIPTLTATEDVTIGIYIRIANGYNCNNVKIYPQVELGSTATDYEQYVGGIPAPNPDYPQDIHVVTGNNTVEVQGKNLWGGKNFTKLSNGVLFELKADGTISANGTASGGDAYSVVCPEASSNELYTTLVPGTYTVHVENPNENIKAYQLYRVDDGSTTLTIIANTSPKTFTLTETTNIGFRLRVGDGNTINNYTAKIMIEQGSTATDYEPYYHAEYPVNLGNIELCKIRDYQDYLYKENGNWYKYGNIRKYGSPNSVSFSSRRINLKSRNNLKNMESTTNVTTPAHWNCHKSSDGARYNYGWGGLAFVLTTAEFSMIGAETTEEFSAWCDENLVCYVAINPTYDDIDITQITDETLISQLDAIYEHFKLTKGINNITVTAEDLAPNMELSYMQDLPTKLNNLASRIELLEE